MKLMFVENRYATWVYEAVAKRLASDGHEIHWLVQNPVFAPRGGQVHKLPFPKRHVPAPRSSFGEYDWLRRTDRSALHFGVDDAHYAPYDRHIIAALEAAAPDVVFGEATEFHELLTIARSRERAIPYLSPSATRYPPDRLAFMAYDTLEPVGGDGSELPTDQADAMLEAIRTRRLVPSYMRPATRPASTMVLLRLADKLRITAGWLAGERFITPSPVRKMRLNAERQRQRERWEDRSSRAPFAWRDLLASGRPWVLYALQMQPEGNIDVWGTPWNDQADIVRRAARALAAQGAVLVVKPNPKSKYEMSAGLNDVMDREPNAVGLAHATPMADVFARAPLVLTVTGTVLLESIFAGKPVACLGCHEMSRYPGVTRIDAPEDLPAVLGEVIAGHARAASRSEARALLQELHATSYAAIVWDPMGQPERATHDNIAALAEAFTKVLARAQTQRLLSPRPASSPRSPELDAIVRGV